MGSNWQSVDQSFNGESIKATDMKVGESYEGTVSAIDEHKEHEGTYFLYLETEEGLVRIFTAGNLSYKIKDGKVKVGGTYKITRLEDTPAKKKGMKARTTFEVLVDTSALAPAI